MSNSDVTCPECDEVQSRDAIRCARCGHTWGSAEQRRQRRATIEQARREAERNDVSIERIRGFGFNGTPRARFGTAEFFQGMSNQLRRRYVIVLAIAVLVSVCAILYGH